MTSTRAAGVLFLSAALVLGQTGPLQIRIAEGDGATVAAGAPSPDPLTVVITGVDGRPVAGVTVTFRLPSDGPAARFSSGMLSESVVTGADGQASVRGVRWGQKTGTAIVRISATLDNERADSQLTLSVAPGSTAATATAASRSNSRKWIVIAGIAAGALAGIAFGMGGGGGSSSVSSTPTTPNQTITINPPTISIGKP